MTIRRAGGLSAMLRGDQRSAQLEADEMPDVSDIEPLGFDPVERPAHYAEGRKFETIDVIEDWELNYHLGQVVKYVSRAGRKGDTLEDLKKARWYLNRYIEIIEG